MNARGPELDPRFQARRLRRGSRVKDYEIIELIASGGFGDVYEAFHPVLARPVAIKISQQRHAGDADLQQRFLREARILAQIRNPHMVTVYDADVHDGRAWMAMELLDGHTLREVLALGDPVPLPDALNIAACIAEGVSAAHERDVVHRDLKPENVFLAADGRIVVMDLGAAKATGLASQTTGLGVIGTAAYMSPEQIERASGGAEVDGRSDVYALAVMLHEMLAGAHPFYQPDMSPHALLVQQMNAVFPSLEEKAPWVPPYVRDIVGRAAAKDREARHGSMRELRHELLAALARLKTERTPELLSQVKGGELVSDNVTLGKLTEKLGSVKKPAAGKAKRGVIVALGLVVGAGAGLGVAYRIRTSQVAAPEPSVAELAPAPLPPSASSPEPPATVVAPSSTSAGAPTVPSPSVGPRAVPGATGGASHSPRPAQPRKSAPAPQPSAAPAERPVVL